MVELIAEIRERRHVDHDEPLVRLHRGHVAREHVVHHVDLAALQALQLHHVVGNGTIAHAIQIRAALLVPVALVALDDEVRVLHPLDELERPRARALRVALE